MALAQLICLRALLIAIYQQDICMDAGISSRCYLLAVPISQRLTLIGRLLFPVCRYRRVALPRNLPGRAPDRTIVVEDGKRCTRSPFGVATKTRVS